MKDAVREDTMDNMRKEAMVAVIRVADMEEAIKVVGMVEDKMIMALVDNRVVVMVEGKMIMALADSREVVMVEDKMNMALVGNREVVMEVSNRMTMALDASSMVATVVEETYHRAASKFFYFQGLATINSNGRLTNCSYGGGGGYGGNDDDLSAAAHHAQQHAGDSGDSNMFSNVANHLGQNKQNIGNQQINEQGLYLHIPRSFKW